MSEIMHTYTFEVTMPHTISDDNFGIGIIADLNAFISQGAAMAWGDDPRDTRYTTRLRRDDKPAIRNTITGTATNVIQAGHIGETIVRGRE